MKSSENFYSVVAKVHFDTAENELIVLTIGAMLVNWQSINFNKVSANIGALRDEAREGRRCTNEGLEAHPEGVFRGVQS